MSGQQLKLSKLFYVDPTLLPPPGHPHMPTTDPRTTHYWTILKESISEDGFDSRYPIIVQLEIDSIETNKYQTLMMIDKMLLEFPKFPSNSHFSRLPFHVPPTSLSLHSHIADGSHRLAVALELKLDHVPVRFQYMCASFSANLSLAIPSNKRRRKKKEEGLSRKNK